MEALAVNGASKTPERKPRISLSLSLSLSFQEYCQTDFRSS